MLIKMRIQDLSRHVTIEKRAAINAPSKWVKSAGIEYYLLQPYKERKVIRINLVCQNRHAILCRLAILS